MSESGWTWQPVVMWRMDAEWWAFQREIRWRVRFTTQPTCHRAQSTCDS